MENKEKKKEDDWIQMRSKSRPGRFYKFNKATGETQWLPHKEDGEKEEKILPPNLTINHHGSKTPAQDRLKRLQHSLRNSQTRSQTSRNSRHSSHLETNSKLEQENLLNDQQPTTSFAAEESCKRKSPRKAIKRTQSSKSNDLGSPLKVAESESSVENKKIRLSGLSNNCTSTTTNSMLGETTNAEVTESLKSISSSNKEHLASKEDKSSTLNNFRSGIVKKIKKIWKLPFNVSKKISEGKSSAKDEKLSRLINGTPFKPAKKSKDIKYLSPTPPQDTVNQIKEDKVHNLNTEKITISADFNTPKNLNIPVYPKGSANSRLERLRQSFISQQLENQQSSDIETPNHNHNLSCETNKNSISTQITGDNNSNYHTANNTINNEIEAMDWQPILKDEESSKIKNSEPSMCIEKSKKLVLKSSNDTNETMGDIYDTVNENLLRFSAEKQKDAANKNKKWHKDFYYFVVDTNVLLRDLTFVEDLTKMKLCNTEGSMLYIPYSVLQELDKLKMRTGSQEGVKTLAVRAIKFLNTKFENDISHLKAQSALEERHRLVDINSADDSIINCCLQAKEHVPNLILLTEDVNLRNKAICNNILVSTKSDLVSKRYNSSDTDNKA